MYQAFFLIGEMLPRITQEFLKSDIGIDSRLRRVAILAAIKNLTSDGEVSARVKRTSTSIIVIVNATVHRPTDWRPHITRLTSRHITLKYQDYGHRVVPPATATTFRTFPLPHHIFPN